MNTFADYILSEQDLASKLEITYYLSKKTKIFFDKSVVLKLELLRLFLKYSKIEVDENEMFTIALLCNCKKVNNAQDMEKIQTYAKNGAEYLSSIGFDQRFCKICEEVNRYSKSTPRERESDILELVDHFGGMILDRPERIGFKPDEALVLLEHRNLKNKYNRYLETFRDFICFLEDINVGDIVNISIIRRLVKIHNETEDVTKFIKKVMNDFRPKVDKLFESKNKDVSKEMFKESDNINRPLFSEETAKKIMGTINKENESYDF